jgi:hypothetical protein
MTWGSVRETEVDGKPESLSSISYSDTHIPGLLGVVPTTGVWILDQTITPHLDRRFPVLSCISESSGERNKRKAPALLKSLTITPHR